MLWRQQWTPPEREDQRVRWLAAALTFVIHLVLLVLLFWLASVHFNIASAPEGEDVVQVEYVGTGTPTDQAGGAPQGTVAQPVSAAAASPPKPSLHPEKVVPSPPVPAVAATPAVAMPPAAQETAEPAPARAQPLQVSQVPLPSSSFTLPPPTPRTVELPQAQVNAPALQVPIRDIELARPAPPVPVPQVAAPTAIPTRPLPAPVVTAPPAPPQPITPRPPTLAAVSTPATPPPIAKQTAPATPPSAKPVQAAAGQSATAAKIPSTAPASSAQTAGGTPAATTGSRPAQAAAGSGPATTARPGAPPSPLRADDWGASSRSRAGGNTGKQPGLFNADGSPRLSAGTAQPGGGFPPGSDHWTRDQFDRAGTWLKRAPNDFTPTRFEKAWVPNETLLEEWVRKNMRTVDIPIPGSSKTLHCVVSLLQLGGGCGITDPNMNDQEAEARPPPDIPFKPELQDDQRSPRKPGVP
ncbi:MAG: hypothetical protein JWL98_731 [Xanthomonadaceae bacterium]|nr:hypothetical protein [Xanthomonadaceae bacterium]